MRPRKVVLYLRNFPGFFCEGLSKAERRRRLVETIRLYARASLLIVVEIGYLPIPQGRANLFFQLGQRALRKRRHGPQIQARLRRMGRGRWRSGRRHCASGSAPGTPTLTVQQELRRRIEKVGLFPNEDSPERLTSAMLVEIADKGAAETKAYIKWECQDARSHPRRISRQQVAQIGLLSGVDTENSGAKVSRPSHHNDGFRTGGMSAAL